jgi:hypothetical protein
MRTRLMVLAVASLFTFAVANAETSELQEPQGTKSAAPAPAAPAAESTAAPDVPPSAEAEAAPAAAASADATGGAERAEATGTSADQVATEESASSQPITVKMATVPPPADFKIPAGYRPVKRGLDTVYCTSITPIGSRMPKTYCMTRAQVEERQRQAEIARRDLAQKTGTCDGGGCGAN